MSYLHIDNLYNNQDILLFKECYAMEKIHGTSSHIIYKNLENKLIFFSGGEKHENFIALFNQKELLNKIQEMCKEHNHKKDIIIYGEVYGGKQQGMSDTYGKELKFITFEVKIGYGWMNVPTAEKIVERLGLEFVPYEKISANIESLDKERDKDSMVAVRRGMGVGKKREGIVLRPLIEVIKNNGDRVIAKHKREEFRETKTSRKVVDPERMRVLSEADKITEEWVTVMRLEHVIDKLKVNGEMPTMEKVPDIIKAVINDIIREGKGEIIDSKEARKAIGAKIVSMFKNMLKSSLR